MKKQTDPNKGRPSKYQPGFAEQGRRLCMLGLTDAQLATFFEVSEQTINNWKHRYPPFSLALMQGKTIADADVAMALFTRAVGYTTTEQRVVAGPDGVRIVDVQKSYPPDVQAARFWLKNRQPNYWREQVPVFDNTSQADDISEEELDALYEASMDKSRKRAEELRLADRGERMGITVDQVGNSPE